MCRVGTDIGKLIGGNPRGAYARFGSPLRRTLRSSPESKSCGWPLCVEGRERRPRARRWRIRAKLSRRSEQIGLASLDGGKMFRRAVIVSTPFRTTLIRRVREANRRRLGTTLGRLSLGRYVRCKLIPFAEAAAPSEGRSDHSVRSEVHLAHLSHGKT